MQNHSHLWENPISKHAWIYLNLLDYIHWVQCRKKYYLDQPLPLCLTGDFVPMGGSWCCSLLLLLPSGTALKSSDRSCWACTITPWHDPSPSPLPSTLGPRWLSPALLQDILTAGKDIIKGKDWFKFRKTIVLLICLLETFESNDNPTGLGLSIHSNISPHNWVKQLVIPIARKHEEDDKGRLIYDHLVSERCSVLFNK